MLGGNPQKYAETPKQIPQAIRRNAQAKTPQAKLPRQRRWGVSRSLTNCLHIFWLYYNYLRWRGLDPRQFLFYCFSQICTLWFGKSKGYSPYASVGNPLSSTVTTT